jgi:hypothetical protein
MCQKLTVFCTFSHFLTEIERKFTEMHTFWTEISPPPKSGQKRGSKSQEEKLQEFKKILATKNICPKTKNSPARRRLAESIENSVPYLLSAKCYLSLLPCLDSVKGYF